VVPHQFARIGNKRLQADSRTPPRGLGQIILQGALTDDVKPISSRLRLVNQLERSDQCMQVFLEREPAYVQQEYLIFAYAEFLPPGFAAGTGLEGGRIHSQADRYDICDAPCSQDVGQSGRSGKRTTKPVVEMTHIKPEVLRRTFRHTRAEPSH